VSQFDCDGGDNYPMSVVGVPSRRRGGDCWPGHGTIRRVVSYPCPRGWTVMPVIILRNEAVAILMFAASALLVVAITFTF